MFLPSQAIGQQIQLSPVVSGLSSPVFVGNADDGLNRLFIVEQAGLIKVLRPGASSPTVFLDIQSRVAFGGEREDSCSSRGTVSLLGGAVHRQIEKPDRHADHCGPNLYGKAVEVGEPAHQPKR